MIDFRRPCEGFYIEACAEARWRMTDQRDPCILHFQLWSFPDNIRHHVVTFRLSHLKLFVDTNLALRTDLLSETHHPSDFTVNDLFIFNLQHDDGIFCLRLLFRGSSIERVLFQASERHEPNDKASTERL